MGSSKDGESLSDEYEAMIKRAQEQPGLKELNEVYGYYDLLVKRTNSYLAGTRPKVVYSAGSSS